MIHTGLTQFRQNRLKALFRLSKLLTHTVHERSILRSQKVFKRFIGRQELNTRLIRERDERQCSG
ncbi:Uncharacterised protein [Vibrio cholerae]|nr:Uncharacterised protein [Vibrio cholerae]CSC96524.1 Uncharacterised protein [Vibrio cholerae]CSI52602.1 Uncharacterised protein [Vibrio cholerae]